MRYTKPEVVQYGRIEDLTLTGGRDALDLLILRRQLPPPPPPRS